MKVLKSFDSQCKHILCLTQMISSCSNNNSGHWVTVSNIFDRLRGCFSAQVPAQFDFEKDLHPTIFSFCSALRDSRQN